MNHGRKSFPLFSFLLAGAFLFSATAFAGPEAQADPGKAKQAENDLKKGGTGGNAAESELEPEAAPTGAEVDPAPSRPEVEGNDDETVKELEISLTSEMERLKRLEAELEAIESAPLPVAKPAEKPTAAGSPAPASAVKAQTAEKEEIPAKPAKGAEEELADMLYSLGEFKKAQQLYRDLADSKPAADRLAWALFQIGNCARKRGDYLGSQKAYEELMNTVPEHPWAVEATWWDAQIKWWVLWRESRRQAALDGAAQ